MIITLAIVAGVSVSRSSLLLRCGDVELNPGPVGRYPGIVPHSEVELGSFLSHQ
jgi:hypothetical protein